MSSFQERLWSELVNDHALALSRPRGWETSRRSPAIVERRRPSLPAMPRWRSVRLAASAAALASAVTAVLITTGASTPPSSAYAVTVTPQGTIEVTIDEMTGVSGANADLAKLGVPVKVVPVLPGCPLGKAILIPLSIEGKVVHGEGRGLAIQPNLIPPGDTLVISARWLGNSGVAGLTSALYDKDVPSCVRPGYTTVH
jgi:hypothetical protein